MQSHKNPTPSMTAHDRKRSHRSSGTHCLVMDVGPTLCTPNLVTSTEETEPPKCLALETNEAYI